MEISWGVDGEKGDSGVMFCIQMVEQRSLLVDGRDSGTPDFMCNCTMYGENRKYNVLLWFINATACSDMEFSLLFAKHHKNYIYTEYTNTNIKKDIPVTPKCHPSPN